MLIGLDVVGHLAEMINTELGRFARDLHTGHFADLLNK